MGEYGNQPLKDVNNITAEINRRSAPNQGNPIITMTAANDNATYDAENEIWECNICDQKYNIYRGKQIINQVRVKHGERRINTRKWGKMTERGMRIKKKWRHN